MLTVREVLGRIPPKAKVRIFPKKDPDEEMSVLKYKCAQDVEERWIQKNVKRWNHDNRFKDPVYIYLS